MPSTAPGCRPPLSAKSSPVCSFPKRRRCVLDVVKGGQLGYGGLPDAHPRQRLLTTVENPASRDG